LQTLLLYQCVPRLSN